MIFSIICFALVTTIFSATSADETIDVATLHEMCHNFTLLVSAHMPPLDTILVSCLEVPVRADLLEVSVQFGQKEKFAKHHLMISEHPSKLPHTILVTTTLENEKEAHSIFDIAKTAFNIPRKRISKNNIGNGTLDSMSHDDIGRMHSSLALKNAKRKKRKQYTTPVEDLHSHQIHSEL